MYVRHDERARILVGEPGLIVNMNVSGEVRRCGYSKECRFIDFAELKGAVQQKSIAGEKKTAGHFITGTDIFC